MKSCIFWIKMEKAKFMAKLAYKNFVQLVEHKQQIIFQNMKVSKIKRFLKRRLKLRGMDMFSRCHHQVHFNTQVQSLFMMKTNEDRAAEMIRMFLMHNKEHHYVKVKIK